MLPFIFAFVLHGYFGARNLVVRKYSVYFEDLPQQFDGYSILHLSDFHFLKCDSRVDTIAEYVRNLPADIAVLTGDFRYKNYSKMHGACESMEKLALGKSFLPEQYIITVLEKATLLYQLIVEH